MTSQQLDEERIFHLARRQPDADAQAEYLDQVCAGDQALRERVEELLRVHHEEQNFLKSNDQPVATTVEVGPGVERPGATIGRYKLMEQIGEGGMGSVFVAQQDRPIRRKVALKVIKPGMDSKAVIARFEAERQALAVMDHPNIAKVLDAGTTDQGRPYFVMELVSGIPITEYCDEHKLRIEERLNLFISVCQAIQHAHQKGIIHRDIKPSNVLVTELDGKAVPKVIDFGVAKALNQSLTDRTIYTSYQSVIGTPLYMSPEQASLSAVDVDTRSDVYSLGVLLYELLTGTTPFEQSKLKEAAQHEVLRIIREEEPPRPSNRISTLGETATRISQRRRTHPYQLGRKIKGDLDWIVMKALAKERSRRFESASLLARDVSRHLAGEVVEARPPTLVYQVSKTWKRHRKLLSATAAIFTLLATGLIAMSIVAKQLKSMQSRTERRLYNANMQNAFADWNGAAGGVQRMKRTLDQYADSPLRGWEYYFLRGLLNSADDPLVFVTKNEPIRLAVSPDDENIIATHKDGQAISVMAGDDTKVVKHGSLNLRKWVHNFAEFANAGDCFLHSDDDCCSVIVRSSESPNEVLDKLQIPSEIADQPCRVSNAIFSRDDARIFLVLQNGTVVGYSRQEKRYRKLHRLNSIEGRNHCVPLCLIHDGSALAVGYEQVEVFNADTGQSSTSFHPSHTKTITSIVEVPDMNCVVTGSRDRTIVFTDTRSGHETRIGPLKAEVRSLAYDRKTKRLAAGCRDGTIRLWKLPALDELPHVRGYNNLYGLKFDRSGTLLYGSDDGIRGHREADQSAILRTQLGRKIQSLRFDPTGSWLLARIDQDPAIYVIDQRGGHRKLDMPGVVSTRVKGLSILAVAQRGKVILFDFQNESVLKEVKLPSDDNVTAIEFSLNFASLILGYDDGRVAELNLTSDRLQPYSDIGKGQVSMIDFLADGTVVTVHHDQGVCLWRGRKISTTYGPYHSWVTSLCCFEDKVAFGLFNRYPDFQVLFGTPPDSLQRLEGNVANSAGVAFIEHGKTLVTMGTDREIKIWDLELREPRLVISDTEIYSAMAVSPDERVIAAGTREGSIILYRADLLPPD